MRINRAKDMFYSHFDRSIQVLVECFQDILGSLMIWREHFSGTNHILVKCRSHAILSFSVASVFLINLLALSIQVLVECLQNILGSLMIWREHFSGTNHIFG